jgi:hypothetical protein
MLGAMAYLAPKQLSVSLPAIVPRLTAVLNDSHMQVRAAGKGSLERFTEVIHNPEIKHLTGTLMAALADPSKKTNDGLTALMRTSFAHYIDAPSLALVIPIIERGLRERGAEVKKKAAHIIGTLTQLTEGKDLEPYLSNIIPLLREVLVDPVPEARAVSANALGRLVEKLGEKQFPNLIGELMRILKADVTGVDREGSALGLAEVLRAVGNGRMEELLPEIVTLTSDINPNTREGFLLLLVYLPTTYGDDFHPYLGKLVTVVLKGFADEFEPVRAAAMKGGQIIINRFARKAIDILLPELELVRTSGEKVA